MKLYTRQDIRALKPCRDYTDKRIDELWGGKEALSAREIFQLDIPPQDRFWALTRLMDDPTRSVARRIWCDQFDSEILPPIAKKWMETGDESIRLAASEAAWAARAAAARAAWAAWAARASYAAWTAWAVAAWAVEASSAAWAVAASAAAWAAWAVAAWAASDAAYEKYLEWVIEFMER